MDSYKERKFRAHKELECLHYGLESIADDQRQLAENKHLEKVDNIKSKVSFTPFNIEIYKIIESLVKSSQLAFARSVKHVTNVCAISHLSFWRR